MESGRAGCHDGPTFDLFDALPAAERLHLERQIQTSNYAAGHLFFEPDEDGEQVLIVRNGRIRLYKLSPEGRALTLFVLEPQALFGEMAIFQRPHDSFAEAVTDCTISTLPGNAVRELLATNVGLTFRLMEMMSERVRTLEHKLADIAFKSVPQRLASVLLNLADCLPDTPAGPPSVVRYTHQQLAEMIGSYRETVTKAIGEFREEGTIRVDDDAMFLLDVPRLRLLAGESDGRS